MSVALLISVLVLVVVVGLAPLLVWAVNEVWKAYSDRVAALQVSSRRRHVVSMLLIIFVYSLGLLVELVMWQLQLQHRLPW